MLTMNATDVRKNWSEVSDNVIRKRPQFIKRTRDYMLLSNIDFMENILSAYSFTADEFAEEDGSVTLSLNELDIVENAPDKSEAARKLGEAILDYASDFYNEFDLWSSAPNRKAHVPYVFKALIIGDAEKIGEGVLCRTGKN